MGAQSLGQKIPWRRAWQPTPVFLPGESHGQRRLVGYSPWDHKGVKYDLHACVLSRFSCFRFFETPRTVVHQVPQSMEFSRQGYWSGLPCPPPGDLLTQGLNSHILHLLDCKQILYY